MNHRIVAIAVTAAFASGLVVGHYAGPRDVKVSRQGVERINKPIAGASTVPSNLDIPQTSNVEVSTSSSAESIIAAIQEAAAHPANGQLHAELSKLVRKLDPEKIRPVIDAIQAVPNQRERNTFMSILISHWAEADPPGALAYVQAKGGAAENNRLLSTVVTTWAQHDAAAAMTWVAQLPASRERSQAAQSLVSVLAEKNPTDALNFARSLAMSEQTPMLYSPIFSTWAASDPIKAAGVALQLPTGPIRDMALRVIGARWSEQNADAAYNWANGLPV
jgi:hypothetical protein